MLPGNPQVCQRNARVSSGHFRSSHSGCCILLLVAEWTVKLLIVWSQRSLHLHRACLHSLPTNYTTQKHKLTVLSRQAELKKKKNQAEQEVYRSNRLGGKSRYLKRKKKNCKRQKGVAPFTDVCRRKFKTTPHSYLASTNMNECLLIGRLAQRCSCSQKSWGTKLEQSYCFQTLAFLPLKRRIYKELESECVCSHTNTHTQAYTYATCMSPLFDISVIYLGIQKSSQLTNILQIRFSPYSSTLKGHEAFSWGPEFRLFP